MKTLGIIGGIGPESTVEYYRKIIAAYREQTQDDSYPPIQINSIDMTKMLTLISGNEMEAVTQFLVAEAEKLASSNADFGLLASNTPHIVFDEVNGQSSIPLLSIVDATCEAVVAKKLEKVGLFGTRFTMRGGFYAKTFAQNNIVLVTPNEDEQEFIHDKYMSELVFGTILPETHDRLLQIVDRLIEEEGIEGLVLGGTELPLILTQAVYKGIPFFDTTQIHVETAVSYMLS